MTVDHIEDFINAIGSASPDDVVDQGEIYHSVFDRGFDAAAFRKRLARGYVIKDKRSSALLSFGVLLAKRAVQIELLRRFMAALKRGGPIRFIVLKSRKLGVSTLTDMLLTELAIQIAGWNSTIIAHTKAASAELFQAVRLTLERMEQAGVAPAMRVNNADMIRFGTKNIDARQAGDFGHQATIQCVGAGDGYALSGQTPNGLHMSECAKWDVVGGLAEQERMILSVMGAVPKVGASIVVAESTANGQQGWFYQTWKNAVANKADEDGIGWIPIFIPWFKDPDCRAPVPPGYRWDAWDHEDVAREKQLIEKYGVTQEQLYFRRKTLAGDMNYNVDYWDQEYPDSWETAFVASGSGFIRRQIMARLQDQVAEPVRVVDAVADAKGYSVKDMPGGTVRIWEDPEVGADYVIGSDVADGITFGTDSVGRRQTDSSSFAVYKRTPTNLIQVAECITQADNYEFGKALAAVGRMYNTALVNVERNRAHAVLAGLRAAEYPTDRMFRPPLHAAASEQIAGNYFFQKTAQNSKMLMETLRTWCAERLVARSAMLVHELGTLRTEDDGRVNTNGKDVTIATAMAIIADAMTEIQFVATGGALVQMRKRYVHDEDPEDDTPENTEAGVAYDSDAGFYDVEWTN